MPAQWDPPMTDEPAWPVEAGGPVLLLVDAETSIERELIKAWIERNQPDDVRVDVAYIPASRRVRRRRKIDPRLEARISQHDDPLLVPLRIVWLATKRDGKRGVSLRDFSFSVIRGTRISYDSAGSEPSNQIGFVSSLPSRRPFRRSRSDGAIRPVVDPQRAPLSRNSSLSKRGSPSNAPNGRFVVHATRCPSF